MDEKCGKKKVNNPKKNTLQHLSVKEMKEILKGVKNINKMTRKELCIELLRQKSNKKLEIIVKKLLSSKKTTKNIDSIKRDEYKNEKQVNLGYINYDGHNSCYIDSTIFALFHTPNKWINKTFFRNKLPDDSQLYSISTEIRQVVKSIYSDLHTGEKSLKCSNLRQLFATFEKTYNSKFKTVRKENQTKWLSRQQEPSDVLNILMKIFNIKPDVDIMISSKTTKRTEKTFFNSPIIDVGELKTNKIVYIKNYIPLLSETYDLDNGSKYTKTTKIINANVLFINVSRNYLNIEKIKTPVIPQEYIELSQKLNCVSILLHHGNNTKTGHYTCMFKYYKKWYHYDDLNNDYKYIGNFDDMLSWNNNYVTKNLVGCFYI